MKNYTGYDVDVDPSTDDDTLYDTRLPNSTRRYQPTKATTTTVMRVIKHDGPPPPQIARASLQHSQIAQRPQSRQLPPQPKRRQQPRRSWLLYAGIVLCLFLVGFIVVSFVSSCWQGWQDDIHYGRPRIYQVDAVVGHNDSAEHPSHFIALNFHGRTQVLEMPGGDTSKMKVYTGPVLSISHELDPVTVSFRVLKADGKLDMILAVNDFRVVFVNDNGAFRPLRQDEQVNM